jgi:hypothetical protein
MNERLFCVLCFKGALDQANDSRLAVGAQGRQGSGDATIVNYTVVTVIMIPY